ncbi:MAG: hypothetical protein II625_07050 [Bacilli bacterium]|nr:hypothetical protein [Bacilli bacterium]
MKIVFDYMDNSYEITNITYHEYDGKIKTTSIGYKGVYNDKSALLLRNFHLTIDEVINEVKMNIREEYKNDK